MKRGRLLWGFGGGQTEKAPPFLKGTAEPERILDLGRRSRSFDAAFLEGGFLYHHGKDQGKDGAGQEEHQSAHVVPLKDAVYSQQADEAPAIGAQLHQAFGGALGDGIGGFVAQDHDNGGNAGEEDAQTAGHQDLQADGMAGDDEDSWKSQFEASGAFDSIDTQIAGLGEIQAIQQLYVAHTQAAIDAE